MSSVVLYLSQLWNYQEALSRYDGSYERRGRGEVGDRRWGGGERGRRTETYILV